ncbi:MAG TPA: YihY/virulence factor BrkB family protein [Burkholderiales bacterium]|nr:YihY/virulence factor BrkB family protein [Burkholderiales bacterium]
MNDRCLTMGAAIAYYTVFSLAPMLILVIATAGLAFGQEAARGAIVRQFAGLMGREGAAALQAMIESASNTGAGIVATVIGVVTLLLAATGAFAEMQAALNVIWKAEPPKVNAVWGLIRQRLLSLSLILAIGFLSLVSLVISTALAAFGDYLTGALPGFEVILQALNFVVSFLVIAALFAMIFKLLPDATIAWRDVRFGALVTTLLFTVGKFLISLYIGSSSVASSYGAAGAFVIILLWIYYSAQIFLFGAEITRAYAESHGTRAGDAGRLSR